MATLRDAERLFVGLPYVRETFDCMHLAVMVQADLFGRIVRWRQQRHPANAAERDRLIRQHAAALARRVDEPRTGDAALMWPAGMHDEGLHIGTVFVERGERWVLHTSGGTGAVLQRLVDAQCLGLVVEGFYRWLE